MIDAAAAGGAERIVYVSSISVYGFKIAGDVTEDIRLRPALIPMRAPRPKPKASCKKRRRAYTIIRPGMIYGAGRSTGRATCSGWRS
ncbi:MAG: hypothetical protein U0521_17470 [Anaerolineae bacterium]